ncbi:hypothetical protein ACFVWY_04030 [Streptomyces sp. NPDC058195]|uniref:hypothetical protein n=1 Tax=Streptomyces sp. NPDC058195 TaxID=3346375 RepID=UPI0036E29804
MPVWAGVLIGAVTGAVLVVLVPLSLIVLVLGLRYVNAPPVPDGAPLTLTSNELTGTWQDDRGGILVVAADGSLSATEACGDYRGSGSAVGSGSTLPSRLSGTGEWSAFDRIDQDGGTEITLRFTGTYDGGDIGGSLYAWGSGDAPVLWTSIGDPDNGDLCVLRKVD